MISIRYRALNEHFIGFLTISTVVIVFWRLYRTKTNEKRRKLLLPITKQPYLGIDGKNSKLFPCLGPGSSINALKVRFFHNLQIFSVSFCIKTWNIKRCHTQTNQSCPLTETYLSWALDRAQKHPNQGWPNVRHLNKSPRRSRIYHDMMKIGSSKEFQKIGTILAYTIHPHPTVLM